MRLIACTLVFISSAAPAAPRPKVTPVLCELLGMASERPGPGGPAREATSVVGRFRSKRLAKRYLALVAR
jgi:hypothetical protein